MAGLTDRLAGVMNDPMFHLGVGLLSQNTGPGAIGRGLLSGAQQYQQAQQLQALQKLRDAQVAAASPDAWEKKYRARKQIDAELSKEFPKAPHVSNTQLVRDPSGKLRLLNIMSSGEAKPVDGYEPTIPLQYLDLGYERISAPGKGTVTDVGAQFPVGSKPEIDTGTGRYFPPSPPGAPPAPVQISPPKSQIDEESKRTVEAQFNLPDVIAKGEEAIRLSNELMTHPGYKQAVGKSSMFGIQRIPGTEAYSFMNRLNQLKGGAFLTAYDTLKGTGQITEVEGKKATDAIARMDNATTEEEFAKAVEDYQNVIKSAIDLAKQKATGGFVSPSTGGQYNFDNPQDGLAAARAANDPDAIRYFTNQMLSPGGTAGQQESRAPQPPKSDDSKLKRLEELRKKHGIGQ
jgi:hypothetical protein